MKIARITLYLLAVVNAVCTNLYREVRNDRSIRKFLRSVVRHDVIVNVQKRDIPDGAERLLDVVTRSVTSAWPTQIFAGTESVRQPREVASSRTLLIYIYATNDDVSDEELNVTLENVRAISYPKHLPRLLLIIGTDEGKELNVRRQLEQLWDHRFLDTIILEVSIRSGYAEPILAAVHLFDGFNEEYTRSIAYADDVDWYPLDPRNMYGNEFKVTFQEVPPYGTFEPKNGTVGGLAKLFSYALSNAMNATVVHTDVWQESDMIYNAQELVYTNWYSTLYEHTVAISDDRICLLTPVGPTEEILLDFWRIVTTIAIGFTLTAIMWYVSFILGASERMRDPLNIVCLIFGVSPLYGPNSLVERVLFVTMMITAAEYTAIFQAELFEFAIEFTPDTRVSTFTELYDTGLEVMVSPIVYKELEAIEEMSPEFKRRFKPVHAFVDSRGRLDNGKAYFRSETDGRLAETTIVDGDGERLFKLCDLCILSHYRVHTLPTRSPFKDEINRVLFSLVECGHANKYVDNFWKTERTTRENEIALSDHSIYVAFLVVLIGHAISLVAFGGELIIGRVSRLKCPKIVLKVAGCPLQN